MKTEQLASDSQASQDRTVAAVEKILPAEIRTRYLRVSFRTAVHGAPLRSPVTWSTWVLKYASKHRSRGRPGRAVLCPRPPGINSISGTWTGGLDCLVAPSKWHRVLRNPQSRCSGVTLLAQADTTTTTLAPEFPLTEFISRPTRLTAP